MLTYWLRIIPWDHQTLEHNSTNIGWFLTLTQWYTSWYAGSVTGQSSWMYVQFFFSAAAFHSSIVSGQRSTYFTSCLSSHEWPIETGRTTIIQICNIHAFLIDCKKLPSIDYIIETIIQIKSAQDQHFLWQKTVIN